MSNNIIYYIIKDEKKYKIDKPKKGISLGINLEKENDKIEIKIAELNKIYSLKDDIDKQLIRNISPQQWLIEIDALDSANEWESNSFALLIFLCIGTIFCQLCFCWLGIPITNWTLFLFLIGLVSSIFGYTKTKKKYFIFLGITTIITLLFSYLVAFAI